MNGLLTKGELFLGQIHATNKDSEYYGKTFDVWLIRVDKKDRFATYRIHENKVKCYIMHSKYDPSESMIPLMLGALNSFEMQGLNGQWKWKL